MGLRSNFSLINRAFIYAFDQHGKRIRRAPHWSVDRTQRDSICLQRDCLVGPSKPLKRRRRKRGLMSVKKTTGEVLDTNPALPPKVERPPADDVGRPIFACVDSRAGANTLRNLARWDEK